MYPGLFEGIVTLSDVMETIACNLPNQVEEIDARHDIPEKAPMVRGHKHTVILAKQLGEHGAIFSRQTISVEITPLPDR